MNRSSPLILAVAAIGGVVVAGAPAAALAQTWPASAMTATGPLVSQARNPAAQDRAALRAQVFRVARAAPVQHPALKLRSATPEADQIPDVELRPKDEWLDDQGVRLTPTRVAYKRRF